jgi:hypothetical protein
VELVQIPTLLTESRNSINLWLIHTYRRWYTKMLFYSPDHLYFSLESLSSIIPILWL